MKAHLLVAKGTIVLLAGLGLGYAVSVSLADDAQKGHALTMKAYIADFERHKADLEDSEIPIAGALLFGIGFTCATFLTYEVLALGLARIITAVDRRSDQ
ncbi:MAG TPA: hypothetical protein VLB49_00160 [Gemmatimonadales bacterium]|nr:hypothetical protein [Gemmatimonadales bacterium]